MVKGQRGEKGRVTRDGRAVLWAGWHGGRGWVGGVKVVLGVSGRGDESDID